MASPDGRAVAGGSRQLASHRHLNRWVRLLAGVVGMMAVASLLFVWPLLRAGPGRGLEESLVAAENAFAAFIIAETVFVPLESWLGERIPRWLLVAVGGALVAAGALLAAQAGSARAQVAWSVLGGVGAGFAYGGTVAKSLRQFTDRKALAVGVTAAACAGVLILALGAVRTLSSEGALPMLVVLGAAQAVVIVVATLFILYPASGTPPPEW
jgi:OFA family oxalate/formate antiporter-like MFS transporter